MKKSLTVVAVVAALFLAVTAIQALAKGDAVTITGMGKCAKCALKQSEACQTVIQAEKDGKTVTYWLTDNEVAKDFHPKNLQRGEEGHRHRHGQGSGRQVAVDRLEDRTGRITPDRAPKQT